MHGSVCGSPGSWSMRRCPGHGSQVSSFNLERLWVLTTGMHDLRVVRKCAGQCDTAQCSQDNSRGKRTIRRLVAGPWGDPAKVVWNTA